MLGVKGFQLKTRLGKISTDVSPLQAIIFRVDSVSDRKNLQEPSAQEINGGKSELEKDARQWKENRNNGE